MLCATEPHEGHRFCEEHAAAPIRNIRQQPISFAGYSIGWHRGADRRGHVSLRIHPERYRSIKAYLLDAVRQVQRLLVELGSEGRAHSRGKRRGARCFPGGGSDEEVRR